MPPIATSLRSEIPSFIVMDVMRRAAALEAAGRSIAHMEVGQPGTPAPRSARAALARALDSEPLGYTVSLGVAPLRQRIARLYRDWYGLDIAPQRVIVTTGSSSAFLLAFLALFDAGQRVAIPVPGYPCYRNVLLALGCEPVGLAAGAGTRFVLEPDVIAQSHDRGRLAGLIVASPANPTGTMLAPSQLSAITKVCRERSITLISDEIYHGLTYGAPAASALQFDDQSIVVNSFSKYFSMTGWRIGWMVVPAELVDKIERLQQNLFISPPTAAQVAALGAFDGIDELEANRQVYAANRELLLAELPRLGFEALAPADGAFYLYADISRMTDDSLAFATAMLEEAGVATTPGIDFDPDEGRHFLRFSYSGSTAEVREAVRRLTRWSRLGR